MFGAGNNPPAFGAGAPAFAAPSTSSSIFGTATAPAFGTGSTVFGSNLTNPMTTSSGVFGGQSGSSFGGGGALTTTVSSNPFTRPTSSSSVFGSSPQASGGNVFGAKGKPSNVFGAGTQAGNSGFGSTSPPTGGFGAMTQASNVFGSTTQTANVFGSATQSSSGFGSGTQASGGFGSVTQPSGGFANGSFGSATQPSGGIEPATQGSRGFGATTQPSSSLGGAPTQSGSVFGGTTGSAPFGQAVGSTSSVFGGSKPFRTTPVTETTSVFGAKPGLATASNVFGAVTSASTVFGGPSSAKNVLGAGSESPTTTSAPNLFGKPASTAATAFGNLPTTSAHSFGSSSVARGAFGGNTNQPSALFGAKTEPNGANLFGKTANQNTTDKQPEKLTSTGSSVAKSLFGKPGALGTTNTGPSQTLFGKTAASTEPVNLFGKSSVAAAQNPGPSTADAPKKLFGRTVEPKSSDEVQPTPVFPEPTDKSKSGLFGKSETGKDDGKNKGTAGRRLIQRLGPARDAVPRARAVGGLFGRAIGDVAGKPRARPEQRTVAEKNQTSGVTKKSPTEGRSLNRRRSTIDDFSSFTVLIAKNVPAKVNNTMGIKKHFSRYGKVTKAYTNPGKNMATVHFEDHDSALNAKKNGALIKQGLPKMSLFWKALVKTANSPVEEIQSPNLKASQPPTSSSNIPKKLFSGSKEVNTELASMAGADEEAFGTGMQVLERPADLQSDRLAGAISGTISRSSRSPDSKRNRGADRQTIARGSRSPDNRRERGGDRQPKGNRRERERARSVSPVSRRRERETVEMPNVKIAPREEDASPVPPAASKVPIVSLKSLIGKKCLTAQDRLDVLEARDKLLREARGEMNKGKDMTTASATRGTCMDMCSEKERYLRQERRRLTLYEIHPESEGRGLVDHARAVKEYSRSSADQDMPLANELRPPEVLDRTMNYILNNIIELGTEGKWSDWYEYIWSRTRGIRKDITQQQLCSQMAVSLVERCARFHIYCAERLCEEDAAVFDMKINDENLTKCLQTLKELYLDLAVKHKQSCPNEAEFRAYIVLMNLNQGDTLRETQQLRQEVRESPQVKFALAMHSAINSNNYIRFFRLVRQATFLDACILHRYFNQVRSRALLTMCMAYSAVSKPAQVPISDFVRLLGFEDGEQVSWFCEQYGLPTENATTIVLIKNNYSEPESALPKRRAIALIESKLTTSAGEAIHGGPLPPNEILTPTSSFDSEGRFCPDAATLQVVQEQEGEVESKQLQLPLLRSASPAPPGDPVEKEAEGADTTQISYSNDAVKAVAKEMFIEVIEGICREMSTNLVQSCHVFLSYATPLTEAFLNEQVPALTRELANDALKEERTRLEQEARARAELSILRERMAADVCQQLTEETLGALVCEVAEEEKRRVDHQLRQESKDRCSLTYMEHLIQEVLTSEADQLAADFHHNEVEKKLQAAAQAQKSTLVLRQRRFFRRWQNKLAGRLRLKRSMLDFPAAPSMDSASHRLRRLLPESSGYCEERNAVHLGNNAWLTLTPPNVAVEKENDLIQEILRQNEEARQKLVLSRSSIDLCKLVGPSLVKRFGPKQTAGKTSQVYWKLLLSLPNPSTGSEEDFCDWIVNKLSTPDDNFPPEIYSRQAKVIGRSSGYVLNTQRQPVLTHIAVRSVTGTWTDDAIQHIEQGHYLQATSAVLFLINRSGVSNHQVWQMERGRLQQVLSMHDPARLALVVAVPQGMVGETRAKLSDLCDYVAFTHFVPLSSDILQPATTLQVQHALEELAKHCPSREPLQPEWLTDYLEHGLQRFFYSKVHNSSLTGQTDQLLSQVASEMVDLYNGAIDHMANVASDPRLQDVSWPPIEFCNECDDLPAPEWNSEETLHYLHELISGLTLPQLETPDGDNSNWSDACMAVWDYVRAVAADTEGTDVFLVTRIRKLLKEAKEVFEDQCLFLTGVQGAEPSGAEVPWSRVVRLCINHKLACLNSLDPEKNQNPLDYDEIRVFYEPDQMNAFAVPDSWLAVCRNAPDQSVLETSIRRAVKRKQDNITQDSPDPFSKSKRVSVSELSITKLDLEPVDPELMEVHTRAGEILNELATEKRAADQYEKYLEDLLKEGDLLLPPVTPLHDN